MRVCSECKEKMLAGYCIQAGLEYYCSDECLHKHYTEEEWQEMYEDGGDSYYTEWEEDEKDIYSMSQEEKKALWAKNDKEYSFPKTLEYTMEELMDDYIADRKHKYGE